MNFVLVADAITVQTSTLLSKISCQKTREIMALRMPKLVATQLLTGRPRKLRFVFMQVATTVAHCSLFITEACV